MSQLRDSQNNRIARVAVVALCGVGLFGVIPISVQQATSAASCPMLGPVPACYVVLLGYTLAGTSMLVVAKVRSALFVAGWIPIFGLALLGSSMQVLGNEACPRSVGDIPGCYLSLTLTTSLILVFLVERIYRPGSPKNVVVHD